MADGVQVLMLHIFDGYVFPLTISQLIYWK